MAQSTGLPVLGIRDYYDNGSPDIDPFRGLLMRNPMNQGNLRQFHQPPTNSPLDYEKIVTYRHDMLFKHKHDRTKPLLKHELKTLIHLSPLHNSLLDGPIPVHMPTGITDQTPIRAAGDSSDARRPYRCATWVRRMRVNETKEKRDPSVCQLEAASKRPRLKMMGHPGSVDETSTGIFTGNFLITPTKRPLY